jgi:TM2 domain-containing membrane protein YozV
MKNKTLAVWLTLVTGPLGLHRLYLRRRFDSVSVLLLVPTLVGMYGVLRAREIGLDDHLSWLLIPWVGLSVAASSLTAIVYGLMDQEKWNAVFNQALPLDSAAGASRWPTIFGVVAALLLGATVLLSSIAFSFQRYFEYEALDQPAITQLTDWIECATWPSYTGRNLVTPPPAIGGPSGCSENKIDRAYQAQTGPDKVHLEGLLHVDHREGHENGERDHLLNDLELDHVESGLLKADAIGRHLQQVLEQGNTPTHQRRRVPGCCRHIFQVAVPGKRHEHVAGDQQQYGLRRQWNGLNELHGQIICGVRRQ